MLTRLMLVSVGVLALLTRVPVEAQSSAQVTVGAFALHVTPGAGYAASIRFLLLFRIPLYPQIACWVETADGTFVQTVYVTRKGGKKDFYSAPPAGRPESLPVWYHRAAAGATADAVSAATSSGGLSVSRTADHPLEAARYVVYLEVNRSYDYNDTWTRANSGVNGQPSLVYRAVLPVTPGTPSRATFEAFGTGSVDGSDGRIRPGLDGITTALTLIADAEIELNAE